MAKERRMLGVSYVFDGIEKTVSYIVGTRKSIVITIGVGFLLRYNIMFARFAVIVLPGRLLYGVAGE